MMKISAKNKAWINCVWLVVKRHYKFIIALLFLLWFYFCIPETLFDNIYSTTISDGNGKLLGAKVAADGQWRFPEIDSIPQKYEIALIEFEDNRFYNHTGFDIISIGRAFIHNLRHGKIREGGSTITMQVVRLARNGKSRTITEKLIETILAIRLELKYKKKEILALYASHAPFGGNVVGIEAAAWRYFGRSASELSWAEAAMLAVLPNSPALIHISKNREQLLRKRNNLLEKLYKKNYLSEEDLRLAKAENIPEEPLPIPMEAMHLFDAIAKKHEGKKITTTINMECQSKATEILNRYSAEYKANSVNNAAAIIIDVRNNTVSAYVGNVGDINKKENGEYVDIITAPRSSGSILKPFLYAAMLDEGSLLPDMLIADVPMHISGFSPQNYDKTFDGAVSAHKALERSLNVPSVRMLYNYNIEKFHYLLRQLGITTLKKPASHYGLSLILGGGEVSLWDITNVYAYFARTLNNFIENNGKYNSADKQKAEFIVNNKKEKNVLQNTEIISAAAIWQTLNSLSDLNRPEEEASWKSFSSSQKIAWKTGTSFGNRDAWAIGVTPDFAVGVWVGNASGEGRHLLTGVNYAAPILFELFDILPKSKHWFEQPYDEMIKMAVCSKSGYLASNICENVDSVWLVNSAQISPICPYHKLVHLNKDETYRVNSDCMALSEIVNKSWFVLPPVQEWYYKIKHHDYRQLPPFMPGCEGEEYSPLDLIYPAPNSEIVITKQIDGSLGSIVFQAVHTNPDATVFWHIDNEYEGTTTIYHQIAVKPSAGEHWLILVDDAGNTKRIKFFVKDIEK
ncbi:MAG: penicillin-binding protein 1C [Prevotellaceae bacterium]|jgi:penicillin-binding protein 1C|nr:penicillin-binding protein 1C [Prevotellaceae bacterium]